MVWVILAVLSGLIGLGILVAFFIGEKYLWKLAAGVGGLLLGVLLLIPATWWQNGVGEAKIAVDTFSREEQYKIVGPGSGFKSPFIDFVDYDLFAQDLTYAGNDNGKPSYTGGKVSGNEVTVTVGGVTGSDDDSIRGGSTRGNVDIQVVYSLGTKALSSIYEEYRGQEAFTERVIAPSIRSLITSVPSKYSPQEFRGSLKEEAAQAILERANAKLEKYDVEVTFVNIQDVRYSDSVEASLAAIEDANQQAEKAEADARTATAQAQADLAKAQGAAAVKLEQARAEAEANRLLNDSLTPQLVELRKAELLVEASKGGGYIIDNGDGSLLLDSRSK